MELCKWKNMFGEPGTGIHSCRFLGIAVADTLMTIIAAVLISQANGWKFNYVFVGLMLVALFFHWLFCVNTTLTRLVGLV